MIETLLAGAILVIGSLGMIGLIINAIASNNRNKVDSTQTMLAESMLDNAALKELLSKYGRARCQARGCRSFA